MTNGQLIKMLSKYPKNKELDIQLFSRLTMRRGDVEDGRCDVMTGICGFNGHVCLQINLPRSMDLDIQKCVLEHGPVMI